VDRVERTGKGERASVTSRKNKCDKHIQI